VSKIAFSKLAYHTWRVIWSLLQNKYPAKANRTLQKEFFTRKGKRGWIFYGKDGEKKILLFDPAGVPIKRHLMIKTDKNPFDPADKAYFTIRIPLRASAGVWDKRKAQLLLNQKGICPVCVRAIRFDHEVEVHHKLAQKDQGSDRNKNLLVLHKECHKQVTHCKNKNLRASFLKEGIISEPQAKQIHNACAVCGESRSYGS